jgi:hypothetical protein
MHAILWSVLTAAILTACIILGIALGVWLEWRDRRGGHEQAGEEK